MMPPFCFTLQVFVKSISEFHSLFFSGCNTRKPMQKVALEPPRRSHKGLMVNISSKDEQSNVKLVGKMNFVDLAGLYSKTYIKIVTYFKFNSKN